MLVKGKKGDKRSNYHAKFVKMNTAPDLMQSPSVSLPRSNTRPQSTYTSIKEEHTRDTAREKDEEDRKQNTTKEDKVPLL